MLIKRLQISNKLLQPWVKFVCYFESESGVNLKLLPTDCIDIIVNIGSPVVYKTMFETIIAPRIHINGLRSGYCEVHQDVGIKMFGISLKPYGLYAFIQKNISFISDKIINLYDISRTLANQLEVIKSEHDIESALLASLSVDDTFKYKTLLINKFLNTRELITVKQFCLDNNLNVKTFERITVGYTGYTPILLRKLHLIQQTGNDITFTHNSLADIALNNSFSDQAHLTRDFKKYTGATPANFIKQKQTVKQSVTYKYD